MFEPVNRVLAWYNTLSRDTPGRGGPGRDRGATAVEYALIVAAIAAVIGVFVFLLGNKIAGAFQGGCAAVNRNASC